MVLLKIGAASRSCPRACLFPRACPGDYESPRLFVKRYRLPQALAALELGEHLDLKLSRPEAEALAFLLVEERPIGPQAELAHPPEQRLVRVTPRRAQDIGGLLSPPHRYDQHAEPVGLEFLREGALRLQPSADEVPARVGWTALVNGAASFAAEVTRLARVHLVAEDRALDPSVAAGGAGAALSLSRGRRQRRDLLERHHRAAALLVLLPAAARAGVVSSDGHGEESIACARLGAFISVYFVILLPVEI